jgi:hypothetical protein
MDIPSYPVITGSGGKDGITRLSKYAKQENRDNH